MTADERLSGMTADEIVAVLTSNKTIDTLSDEARAKLISQLSTPRAR